MTVNRVSDLDLQYIFRKTLPVHQRLQDARVLVTGCAGFLGHYFLRFFERFASELGIRQVIGLDNFMVGRPSWLSRFEDNAGIVQLHNFDIARDSLSDVRDAAEVTHVLHMASIASPTFYRKYPIETLDANVWGLRRLLDYYQRRNLEGLLFFSSSEVYGDPDAAAVPTVEDYPGRVAIIGPRACYDEAKRFGETLSFLFASTHGMPIRIVRPFNNFGPGMKLDDQRAPADFLKAVLERRNIVLFSDGSPRRTFCYVADAVQGFMLALCHGQFDYFNIGADSPEISIAELAQIYVEQAAQVLGSNLAVEFKTSADPQYLTHNPQRRCPDISKARRLLGYAPEIQVSEGVNRFIRFFLEEGQAL